MLDTERLRNHIASSGLTIKYICKKIGITRESFYNKLTCKSEFKASEIYKITKILGLTKAERDKIFFNSKGE